MPQHHHDDERVVIIERHSAGLGAFLVGLGVGAATALLLAPQSGDRTRQDIARRAQDAGDTARRRAQDLVDDVSSEVTGRMDRARSAVVGRVDRAKDAVDLKRRQVQRAVEAGRLAAAQAREDLERRIAQTKAAYQAAAETSPGRVGVGVPAGYEPGGYELPEDGGLDG